MENGTDKVEIWMDALPNIQKFANTTMVIKYGGSAMVDPDVKGNVLRDIALLKALNIKAIIVHGGGPAINVAMEKANLKSSFKNGLRITDRETVSVVEYVLSGSINKAIVSDLQRYGLNAVGISGKDGKLMEVKKSPEDIGNVGEIVKVNPRILEVLMDHHFVPVISPVSADEAGNTYNINADHTAVEIAITVGAIKLIFLTDVDGILRDKSHSESLIPRITSHELLNLIDGNIIYGGMIPKVQSCIKAVEHGVNSVHIMNANVKHALLSGILMDNGIGTIIEK